jgi:hypothetical protein
MPARWWDVAVKRTICTPGAAMAEAMSAKHSKIGVPFNWRAVARELALPFAVLCTYAIPVALELEWTSALACALAGLALAATTWGAGRLVASGGVPLLARTVKHEAAFGAGISIALTAAAWAAAAAALARCATPPPSDDAARYIGAVANDARYAASAAAQVSAAIAIVPFILAFGATQFLTGRVGEVAALMQVRSRLYLWSLSASLTSAVTFILLLAGIEARAGSDDWPFTCVAMGLAGAALCAPVAWTLVGTSRLRGLAGVGVALPIGALVFGFRPQFASGLNGVPWLMAVPVAAGVSVAIQGLMLLGAVYQILPKSWLLAHDVGRRISVLAVAAQTEFRNPDDAVEAVLACLETTKSACSTFAGAGDTTAIGNLAAALLREPADFTASVLAVYDREAVRRGGADGMAWGLDCIIRQMLAARAQSIASSDDRRDGVNVLLQPTIGAFVNAPASSALSERMIASILSDVVHATAVDLAKAALAIGADPERLVKRDWADCIGSAITVYCTTNPDATRRLMAALKWELRIPEPAYYGCLPLVAGVQLPPETDAYIAELTFAVASLALREALSPQGALLLIAAPEEQALQTVERLASNWLNPQVSLRRASLLIEIVAELSIQQYSVAPQTPAVWQAVLASRVLQVAPDSDTPYLEAACLLRPSGFGGGREARQIVCFMAAVRAALNTLPPSPLPKCIGLALSQWLPGDAIEDELRRMARLHLIDYPDGVRDFTDEVLAAYQAAACEARTEADGGESGPRRDDGIPPSPNDIGAATSRL